MIAPTASCLCYSCKPQRAAYTDHFMAFGRYGKCSWACVVDVQLARCTAKLIVSAVGERGLKRNLIDAVVVIQW